MMDLHLSGKIALVTGASRGLGFATARLLAQEGSRVAINSRSASSIENAADRLKSDLKADVFPISGDMTDPAVPAYLVEATASHFGGLDILIVNAGGPPAGAFESFDEAAWQNAINLSFMSAVRLIKAALPYLRKSEAASVLTVTSSSVKQPIPDLILSNSVRAATAGLTKSLALELGRDKIRFNSILPAWTSTDRVQNLMDARAQINGTTVEEEIENLAADTALGRLGTPEEFANAAVFLVSPAASFITGVMLNVDGGTVKGTL